MPRKVDKRSQYPFQVELHVTKVATREGAGVVVARSGEWIQVHLPGRGKIVRTSLFLVDKVN